MPKNGIITNVKHFIQLKSCQILKYNKKDTLLKSYIFLTIPAI